MAHMSNFAVYRCSHKRLNAICLYHASADAGSLQVFIETAEGDNKLLTRQFNSGRMEPRNEHAQSRIFSVSTELLKIPSSKIFQRAFSIGQSLPVRGCGYPFFMRD